MNTFGVNISASAAACDQEKTIDLYYLSRSLHVYWKSPLSYTQAIRRKVQEKNDLSESR